MNFLQAVMCEIVRRAALGVGRKTGKTGCLMPVLDTVDKSRR